MTPVACRAPLATIAVVDDDPTFLRLLHEALTDAGYDARAFLGDADPYPRLRDLRPDAIVLDIPAAYPAAGWALVDRVRRDATLGDRPLIACAPGGSAVGESLPARGGAGLMTLVKPFTLDELLALLARALGR